MPASYLPYEPDQDFLLPPSLSEWLPEGHLSFLAAGNQPAGRTIRDFRAFHLKELGDLFVQVVKLAMELGLVKLNRIAEPPNGWIKSVLGFSSACSGCTA